MKKMKPISLFFFIVGIVVVSFIILSFLTYVFFGADFSKSGSTGETIVTVETVKEIN